MMHQISRGLIAAAFIQLGCGDAGGSDEASSSTGDDPTGAVPTTSAEPSTGGETGTSTEHTTGDATTGGPPSGEAPAYDQAFPQDRVPRIDLTIAAADWQAMLDDMTDMAGEFGAGMGMGMMPPEELYSACEGLAMGDECAVDFNGMALAGTCTDFMGMGLLCLPDDLPGMMGGGVDLLPRTPIYVECDVAVDDDEWAHVGVRFKGNSSLASAWGAGVYKLPLRLNFDKYEDVHPETEDQRFHGFESLSLSNGWSDASLVRDKLGTDVFVRAGVPAPASAFYRVFIDHGDGPTYFGLYTAIELPSDESFLDTHFGGHQGNLYKPDGDGARFDVWDPASLEKENNEDAADFSDAKALFDALHADRSDAAAWRAGLEAALDVDGFLHWLALNTVIQDWDTYGIMPHNYYLYADPQLGGRLRWIPWDHSFAFSSAAMFQAPLSLGMDEVDDKWPLIRDILDDSVYAAAYRDRVAAAAATEYAPTTASMWFTAAHDLIAPYVIGPDGELPDYTFLASDQQFEDAHAALQDHAVARQAAVEAFLEP